MFKTFVRTVHLLTALVLFIFTIVFLFNVHKLGIVPSNYFWIITGVISLVTLIFLFILLKKSRNIFMRILKCLVFIICILLFWAYGYIIHYADKTKDVFNSFIAKNEEVMSYYFISMKDSGYTEISDLDGKTVGYFMKLDDVIKEKLKLNITFKEYSDSELMIQDLQEKTIDGIIVTDLLKTDLEAEDDFDEKYSLVETISVTNRIEDITKRVSIKNTPFNILISGSDTRSGNINAVGNSDVTIVVSVNPNTNEILLVSVPRDYYVQFHGTTGYKDKITHTCYYGINMHVQTVEDLFDIPINYYVKVHFETVTKLVDAIGGIDIYSDKGYSKDGCTYVLGMNHLDGKCALRFARERKIYQGGDRHRIKNQQDVIKAVFAKMKNSKTLAYNYMDILDAIEGEFLTNLPIDEATNFVKYELNDLSKYEIYSYQVDRTNAMEYTYSYPNQKLYVMTPKQETVDHAKELLTAIQNGESLKDLMG